MSILHVVDVAVDLQLVIHGSNDDVEAVSNQSDLLVEFGVSGQSIDSNTGELGEVLLDARSLFEEPLQKQH